MARTVFVCINLFLLIFSALYTPVYSVNDDGFYYDDGISQDDASHQFNLLPDHHLQKRQTTNDGIGTGSLSNDSKPTQLPTQTNTNENVKPTMLTTSQKSVDDATLMSNITKSEILKDSMLGKNLGENGTGIWRSTTSPPLLHSPASSASPVNETAEGGNVTIKDDNDINIDKFSNPNLNLNKSLEDHNINKTQEDTHVYYNSSFTIDADLGKNYWKDMDNTSNVKVNDLLSRSHRRAATVKLSFDFPFYGHPIRNVTIATGGFMYTGEYVHSWLAATQYIAPLMANFDTSLSNDSYIKYVDNGTAFTVLWERVSLQDKPDAGEFTFQATLHSSGDIVFVYQNVPVIIGNIQDNYHPVKIGLSDAYIIDRTIYFIRKKTIYEYHRVNFQKEDIKNWTVIYLQALPTCLKYQDCHSCLTSKIPKFQCTWCPTVRRCSNGMDRHRQDWLAKGCDKRQYKNDTDCAKPFDPNLESDIAGDHEFNADLEHFHHHVDDMGVNIGGMPPHSGSNPMSGDVSSSDESAINGKASSRVQHGSGDLSASSTSDGGDDGRPVPMGVSGVMVVLSLAGLVVAIGFWIMYAYRNPHTTSGQMLIRYRPSQWRWRRGEARYTAATIHM